MFIITPKQLNISDIQYREFENDLFSFYKTVLSNESAYNSFVKNLQNLINNSKQLSQKDKAKNIANYIKSQIFYIDEKSADFTSTAIAAAYLNNEELFSNAYMGGRVSFSDYMKCFVASKLTKDNTEELLLKNQLVEITREMGQMRYYYFNPPDLLLQ